ncbi:MAG: dihydrolipoyl dehydrogenase [Pseudomonadota bacterium]
MEKKITVIGSGPGGYVAAIRAAQLGAEVTVIEQDNLGGTCLNWGCIPSKVMKTTAEMLENLHRAKEFGILVSGEICLDMKRLMDRKQKVIRIQIEGIQRLFDHHKIRIVKGFGYIKGPKVVEVRSADHRTIHVPWDKLILAMGSLPLDIPSFPVDGKRIISSREALELQEIPESMLIVGGGVIGCEFGFIFSSFGSKVTVLEAMDRLLPLPSVDEDCSKIIQREMKKRKIGFILNRTVEEVNKNGEKCRVTLGPSPFATQPTKKGSTPLVLEVDKVLVCIGRKPNTAHVGLENLFVKTDEKGWILADGQMKTSATDVYAIGDLLGPSKVMLAHVASREGLIAAENAAGGRHIMNYDVVPGAIFTMPEVAHVGLTEPQAREHGYNVRSDSFLFRNLGKAQVIGEIAGQAKIVSDKDNGRILGIHMVGPHATDLIAEGTLGMRLGCTVKELAETIHAHPTLSEVMMEVSFKALDKALHG